MESDIYQLCQTYRTATDKRIRDNAFDAIANTNESRLTVAQLIKKYKPKVSAITADDLQQEILISLIRAIENYDPTRGTFHGLFYVVANGKLSNLMTRQYKRGKTLNTALSLNAPCGDATGVYERADRHNAIAEHDSNEAVSIYKDRLRKLLPPFQYKIFCSVVFEDNTYTEVADATGTDRKYVDNCVWRARQKIRQQLGVGADPTLKQTADALEQLINDNPLKPSNNKLTQSKGKPMPITITTPVVVPSETFNLVRVVNLRIDWNNPNRPVTAQYALQVYSEDEYGTITDAPTKPILGRVSDLFTEAATRAEAGKPALANALTAVLAALQELEHEKGSI